MGGPKKLKYITQEGTNGFGQVRLQTHNANCFFLTNFPAAFTTEAFFIMHRDRFPLPHLENFNRTDFRTFFATLTFFLVNTYLERHFQRSPFAENWMRRLAAPIIIINTNVNTNEISHWSLREAERRSNPRKNEIATPSGLAMTVTIIISFVLVLVFPPKNCIQKWISFLKRSKLVSPLLLRSSRRPHYNTLLFKVNIFKKIFLTRF